MASTDMSIDGINDSRIKVSPFEVNGEVAALTRDASIQGYLWPAEAFAITNLTSKPIMVMVVEWQMENENGHVSLEGINLDNYIADAAPLIPAGETAVVSIRGSVLLRYLASMKEGAMLGPFPMISPREAGAARHFKSVKVRIDSVIFDDGEIVGDNVKRYENVIRNRYQAAQAIAIGVRKAASSGADVKSYLHKTKMETDKASNDIDRWRWRFAARLEHSADPIEMARMMEQQAIPGEFYKKDNEKESLKREVL